MCPAESFHFHHSFTSLEGSSCDRNPPDLVTAIRLQVVARIARLAGVHALVSMFDDAGGVEDAALPVHPACKDVDDHEYCRESWQMQCAELAREPTTLWHRCAFGRYCGVVPLVYCGRCVAGIKLACRDTLPVARFKRILELAQVLVENFAVHERDQLAAHLESKIDASNPHPREHLTDTSDNIALHPQVTRALDCIGERLSDPKLTVHGIASHVGCHPDYLAHLFVEQVGERMSRYISRRRVALARQLLTTTDWQIKRVAWACGFTNPNWFSHVFGVHTGTAPRDFRAQARGA